MCTLSNAPDDNNNDTQPITTPHKRTKQPYQLSSLTTNLQSSTEDECSPYFREIDTLSEFHIAHLQELGLLNTQSNKICLLRPKHKTYLTRPFTQHLSPSYISLDASKTWILYWCIHSLDVLDYLFEEEDVLCIIETLDSYWMDVNVTIPSEDAKQRDDKIYKAGGFGGGPNQIPHCATTYAAILTLCIFIGYGTSHNLESISSKAIQIIQCKRQKLHYWFLSLRYPFHSHKNTIKGNKINKVGYRMHHDGEIDVRATYTVLSITTLLNICTTNITNGIWNYIACCQTYEGGFGGEEGNEAHGGYTFCAVASLRILMSESSLLSSSSLKDNDSDQGKNKEKYMNIDYPAIKKWLVKRQMSYEGGFSGRCNKLVDGCYSFWVGGALAIVQLILRDLQNSSHNKKIVNIFDSGVYRNETVDPLDDPFGVMTLSTTSNNTCNNNLPFDQHMLQQYILLCTQDTHGGLKDKPSRPKDFYHSCYVLSGLSVCQHCFSEDPTSSDNNNILNENTNDSKNSHKIGMYNSNEEKEGNVVGRTHPLFNIRVERVRVVLEVFYYHTITTTINSDVSG